MNTTATGLIRRAQLLCQDPNGQVLTHESPYTGTSGLATRFLLGEESSGEIIAPGILHTLSDRGRFLGKVNYISAVADQNRYAFPNDVLSVRFVSYRINSRWVPLGHRSLRYIKRDRAFAESDTYPNYWDFGENARIVRVTGTADAGGSGTSLVDAAVNFTLGTTTCYNGDLAFNETDDSEATINVPANGSTTTSQLAGGSDNTWASGDTYTITSPHAPLRTLTFDLAPSASDAAGTESVEVVYMGRHRDILIAMLTASPQTDWLELPPEMEEVATYELAAYGWMLKEGPDSRSYVNMTNQARSKYIEYIPKCRNRVEEWLSRWDNGDSGYGPITITNTSAVYPSYITF